MLDPIENSFIAVWIRESTSIFGYTFVLSLHAMGLAVAVGLSSVIGVRLLGVAPEIPLAPTVRLFPLIYAGFWVNAVSGLLLLAANATSMLGNTMFYIKIAFIVAAVIALRLIRNRVYSDASTMSSGSISRGTAHLPWIMLLCWLGAIIAGRLTAYPYFVAEWLGI